MECLECDGKNFTEKNHIFNVDFRGETITVESLAYVCDNCGFTHGDNKHMNALRKAVADKYREMKGLLTSEEIKECRQKLGMSQREFAEYLKVGEASVKRWETYFIQDGSNDDHIRIKCFKEYNDLTSKILHDPDIYTGKKTFDLQLMFNVILHLIDVFKSKLYINKALFYADFLHYYRHEKGITGSVYCSLDYGPCPDKYEAIFKIMADKKYIAADIGHDIVANKGIDSTTLLDSHYEVIEIINNIGKEKGIKFLYNLSHKELAYKKKSQFMG